MNWLKKLFKNNSCDCEVYCGAGSFKNSTKFCDTRIEHLTSIPLPKHIPSISVLSYVLEVRKEIRLTKQFEAEYQRLKEGK